MLEMWDFWDVGCEMFAGMLTYKMPFVKQKILFKYEKNANSEIGNKSLIDLNLVRVYTKNGLE